MKKQKKAESAEHKKLADELISFIPLLDEEGLSFLVSQAYIHLHNMEIDRQEAEDAAADAASAEAEAVGIGKSGKTGKSVKTVGGTKKAGFAGVDQSPANFRIERSSSGSSYHIISGGKWKMYNEGEMMRIVTIVSSNDPLPEVTERLHAWLMNERPDTFADLEIGDHRDPKMQELVLFLRKKFVIKKR
jgi:hypothetical protein